MQRKSFTFSPGEIVIQAAIILNLIVCLLAAEFVGAGWFRIFFLADAVVAVLLYLTIILFHYQISFMDIRGWFNKHRR